MENILKYLIEEYEQTALTATPAIIKIFKDKLNMLYLTKDNFQEDFILLNTSKTPYYVVVQNSIKITKKTKSIVRDVEDMLCFALNDHVIITKRMYERKENNPAASFEVLFGANGLCGDVPKINVSDFEVQKIILNSIDIRFSQVLSADDIHLFSLKQI